MSPRLLIFCVIASLQAIATDRESLPSPKKHCAASIRQAFSVRPNLSPDPNRKAGGFRREEKETATFSENETADVLSRAGFSVELLENVPGGNGYGGVRVGRSHRNKNNRNPDLLIANEPFEIYTPISNYPHPIITVLNSKARKQANRIVLDLSRSQLDADTLNNYIQSRPDQISSRVFEIIVIKNGAIISHLDRSKRLSPP